MRYAHLVIVVDDDCPQRSGAIVRDAYASNDAVRVVERDRNGGVGAAFKIGIAEALSAGASTIVKIDADGQMDPSYVPAIDKLFRADPSLVAIKGNRFFHPDVSKHMPTGRLLGNGVLSLCAKFASGYWNLTDPTNGYLAFHAARLRTLPWETFADSYFFEMSVLCELGLRRLPLLELEMPAIYTDAPSSLSIRKVLFEFPPRLFARTWRRFVAQYILFDVNLGTLYAFFGAALLLFALVFGGYEWIQSIVTHIGRATGTVMIAVLTFLMGFQLLLNALMFDVQFSMSTRHEFAATVD